MNIYYGITSTMAGLFLLMIGTYFLFMYLARRELAKLPYSKYRVPNMGLRLQVHIQVIITAIFFVCVVFMWCAGWPGQLCPQLSLLALLPYALEAWSLRAVYSWLALPLPTMLSEL